MTDGLSAISLFSGCGGMDLGVKRAGFNIMACVEIDPNCCSSLRANISKNNDDALVVEGSVCDINPNELLENTGLGHDEVDLLFGGPPCQSFSQIGKQNSLDDDRGMLIYQLPRFAKTLRPKAVLMEEVKGLLTAVGLDGKHGGAFKQLVSEFEALGYRVFWKVLLASEYGVPQNRERLFTVALKGDEVFRFPNPTHCSNPIGQLFPLKPYTTVGEALRGLKKPKTKEDTDVIPKNSHYDITPRRDRERIHGVPEGKFLAGQLQLPAEQRGRLTRKDTTKFLRLDRKKPSNTLRGGEIFFHPTQDRYLTPREYMRIHSYPDSYVLKGPIRGRSGTFHSLDQHRQIANSVPPLLAEQVALQVMESIQCL